MNREFNRKERARSARRVTVRTKNYVWAGRAHGPVRATTKVYGVDAVQLTRFAKKPIRTGSESMKSVLLVDDDNTILLGTGVRLKSMGYCVYTAKDAVSAISAVVKNRPDVVVLDVSLPAGDGFLVARRLQNLVGSAATPIIFITASENPSLCERAMNLGAAAFLKKPFDATTLADAIESALSPGDNWLPRAIGQ
jgi:CheY-like chemotaxis protein